MDFERAYRLLVEATELQSLEVAQAVAKEFGDSLLIAERVSDEHVDFICRVLTDPEVVKQPGLDELIVSLYLDRQKLSERQLDHVFGCLPNSFDHLTDEHSAFVIGDFIARVAAPERALALLLNMAAKVTSRQTLAGVYLGLDILRKHPAGVSPAAIEAAYKRADERTALLDKESSSG